MRPPSEAGVVQPPPSDIVISQTPSIRGRRGFIFLPTALVFSACNSADANGPNGSSNTTDTGKPAPLADRPLVSQASIVEPTAQAGTQRLSPTSTTSGGLALPTRQPTPRPETVSTGYERFADSRMLRYEFYRQKNWTHKEFNEAGERANMFGAKGDIFSDPNKPLQILISGDPVRQGVTTESLTEDFARAVKLWTRNTGFTGGEHTPFDIGNKKGRYFGIRTDTAVLTAGILVENGRGWKIIRLSDPKSDSQFPPEQFITALKTFKPLT